MTQNILSGTTGSVKISTTTYSFGKWKAEFKTKLPDVTNFNSGGYRQRVTGITEATVTLSGPYDQGNMPFTAGTAYTLLLGWTSLISLSVPILVESIKADNDVDGNPTIEIVGQSTGSFTAAIT